MMCAVTDCPRPAVARLRLTLRIDGAPVETTQHVCAEHLRLIRDGRHAETAIGATQG